jgi:hypothetical protein
MESNMARNKLAGNFAQIVYSPHGGIEGFLMDSDAGQLQFVVPEEDPELSALLASLERGQALVVDGEPLPPSDLGEGDHPVHAFRKILSVDGAAPPKVRPASGGYSGAIVNFNYARHGAPNGFVLDSGDFVHVRPEGFAKLKLKIGDRVQAEGDAHYLSTGDGWAVEASRVNGKTIG